MLKRVFHVFFIHVRDAFYLFFDPSKLERDNDDLSLRRVSNERYPTDKPQPGLSRTGE